jgi:hypothetical protein
MLYFAFLQGKPEPVVWLERVDEFVVHPIVAVLASRTAVKGVERAELPL